jgi:RNA polymerase sigma-70 factor (ECF subfamily)
MSDFQEFGVLSGLEQATPSDRETSPLEAEVIALFDESREPLLRYLRTFRLLVIQDCEEIVQEAFLALFRHLKLGRSRHNLRAWLFRVVHNLALKRIQRARRDSQSLVALSGRSIELATDPALNPEEALTLGETHRRLTRAVGALPEQDRQCLALRAEGLRYREIAAVLDMSLGSVNKSLERSLARIARVAERC